jgi:hypothetical protein
MPPTVILLEPFQELFHLFEEEFYPEVFPGCVLGLIPINPNTISYFHADKFQDDEGLVYHEIGINRVYLGKLPEITLAGQLLREMVRLWIYLQGTGSQKNYITPSAADELERVGLQPTGNTSNRRTGYGIHQVTVPGGRFEILYQDFSHRYGRLAPLQERRGPSRIKTGYRCPVTGTTLFGWGAPTDSPRTLECPGTDTTPRLP